MSTENKSGPDIEKGFGTGLRAQLARRTDADEPSEEQAAPVPAPPPSAEPAFVVYGTAEAEAVKAELVAAGERERHLRGELDALRARLETLEVAGVEASSARSARCASERAGRTR